jgi:hypothetical protein
MNEKLFLKKDCMLIYGTNEIFECNTHKDVTVNGVNVLAPQNFVHFYHCPTLEL